MTTLEMLQTMKHSPIFNYGGIPGLTSWLIGTPSEKGTVRLMESSREHQEPIIPHSHRFDFHCIVLAGRVQNKIWTETQPGLEADDFMVSSLVYAGAPGKYERIESGVSRWQSTLFTYRTGQEYSMKADEVHSIFFGRNTSVLFFEGPTLQQSSIILEPYVQGERIPMFKVEPWAFKRPMVSCSAVPKV